MNWPERERRKEPRAAIDGEVDLLVEDPLRLEVCGRLLEVSPGGFRVGHACVTLLPGQEVRYRDQAGEGRARVMWNRVVADRVETGFLIL